MAFVSDYYLSIFCYKIQEGGCQNLTYPVVYINYVLKLTVTSGQMFVYYNFFVRDVVFICLDEKNYFCITVQDTFFN